MRRAQVFTRIRRRWASDEGITLVETMVVMMLSALILLMATTMFVNVATQTTKGVGLRSSTADASNIMNSVSTTIRAAVTIPVAPDGAGNIQPNKPAILSAAPYDLTVFTYTDAGPTFPVPLQIRYYTDAAGRMIEQRWVAKTCNINQPSLCAVQYPTYNATTTTPNASRVLGNLVVNVSQCAPLATDCVLEPLFSYFDKCGAPIGNGSAALTAAQILQVASIEFNVKVRADDSKQVVTLDNMVGMPNLNNKIVPGGCTP